MHHRNCATRVDEYMDQQRRRYEAIVLDGFQQIIGLPRFKQTLSMSLNAGQVSLKPVNEA